MKEYKYEVAFSFLKDDEHVAMGINDLIQDRLSTFIYSKRQEELAGTDGEETFNRVFGEEARVVVVLYRSTWGSTPWTRIEEIAIRNRAFEEGYDFTVFIPLDESPTMPKWLPKTYIWANIKRWGIEGAANIIESKVQQAGGEIREERLEERALRFKRQAEFEKEKRQFLKSELGVEMANEEVEKLIDAITLRANDVATEAGLEFRIEQSKSANRWIEVNSKFHCVSIDWFNSCTNTLDESRLVIELWEGKKKRIYRNHRYDSHKLLDRELSFDRDQSGEYYWRDESQSLYRKQLAEYCIKLLIDYLHQKESSIT
jgi:hypothetical protein